MKINIIKKADNKFIYENYKEKVCFKRELIEVSIKQQIWQNLNHFIILPFSIDAAIYTGISGGAKIASLIQTVKHYAKNKILILLCDGAHLNFLSAEFKCSIDEALNVCQIEANNLIKRFKEDFNGCELMHWSKFIFENKNYDQYKSEVMDIYKKDYLFDKVLEENAEKINHIQIIRSLDDKKKFIEKTKLDYLEMIVGVRIMHDEHYRTHIYPGLMPESFTYLQSLFYPNMFFINANIRTRVLA